MAGLIKAVYEFVGEISNPENNKFNLRFHKFLEMVAYNGVIDDYHKQSPEIYWNAAKAYVALALTTNKKVHLSRDLSSGFFMPPKEELPLCQRDAEIVALGLRFKGSDYGFNTSPYIPRDAENSINQYIQILRNNWYGKRKTIKSDR